jgi:hypothetical protein
LIKIIRNAKISRYTKLKNKHFLVGSTFDDTSRDLTTIQERELEWRDPLGHGSFGFVTKAIWSSPSSQTANQVVAVKVIANTNIKKIKNEVSFLLVQGATEVTGN